MHLIQITDLHIGTPEQRPFEIDVRANLQRTLALVVAAKCDLLVVSGDLCYDYGDPDIYAWVKDELDQTGLPYVVLPGNHDDTDMMVEAFGLQDKCQDHQLFFVHESAEKPIVFLDSGTGQLSSLQLQFLMDYLREHQQPICLFMHHPPLPMGVPYMDNNHAFQSGDALLPILRAHPYPIHIFTGHYHVDKSVQVGNLNVHITPSLFFQLNWRAEDFEVDHHRCAYRSIRWNGTRVEQGVTWVD